jgi:hypothetical protein
MVDSSCCPATKQTRVVSVERVENESLWQMYQLRRDILKKNVAAQGIRSLSAASRWQPAIPSKEAEMSLDINEFYLFHGTSSKSAHIICKHGFDEHVADLNGLYGAGSYFAINSCKSHQYSLKYKDSSTFVMLVCRVVMGSPYFTSTQHNGQRRPPDNAATPGRPFDSIFAEHGIGRGGQQQHNEYVVFDRLQVYPEYIVRYTQCKGAAGQVSRVEALHLRELEALDLTPKPTTIVFVVHLEKTRRSSKKIFRRGGKRRPGRRQQPSDPVQTLPLRLDLSVIINKMYVVGRWILYGHFHIREEQNCLPSLMSNGIWFCYSWPGFLFLLLLFFFPQSECMFMLLALACTQVHGFFSEPNLCPCGSRFCEAY